VRGECAQGRAGARPRAPRPPMNSLARWIHDHAPHLTRSLGNPATAADLADAEALFGRQLPADYLDFLRLHDGQRFIPHEPAETATLARILHAFELVPVAYAAGEWRSMREWGGEVGCVETSGPVRARFVHDAWWPFTVIHGSSWHHCLDLDPAPGGAPGQVIV